MTIEVFDWEFQTWFPILKFDPAGSGSGLGTSDDDIDLDLIADVPMDPLDQSFGGPFRFVSTDLEPGQSFGAKVKLRVTYDYPCDSDDYHSCEFTAYNDILWVTAASNCSEDCPGDIDGDGIIDGWDVYEIANELGIVAVLSSPFHSVTDYDTYCETCGLMDPEELPTLTVGEGVNSCFDINGDGYVDCEDIAMINAFRNGNFIEGGWDCGSPGYPLYAPDPPCVAPPPPGS